MAKFTVTSNSAAWKQAVRDQQKPVVDAAVKALRETAANAVAEGRRDIAGAGRFGAKWQGGLQYNFHDEGLQSRAVIFHRFGFAGVFEFGATISGKPLLWIPTTPGAPGPKQSGKKLVSVNIAGKAPMLFDAADHDRHKKPLYVGVKQAVIKPRFHIREIVARQVKRIGLLFIKYFVKG